MAAGTLRLDADCPYRALVGVGGIGSGMFFTLEGDHTLGRNESRPARLRDVRDYCKLHIIAHYVAGLLGADPSGEPFHVAAVGKVGDDELGRRLRAEMAAAGVDVRHVEAVEDKPTLRGVCFQYPDGSGGNITMTDSAAAALSAEDIDRAEPLLSAHGGRCIALAAPEAPLEARDRLLTVATRHGAFRAAGFTSAEIAQARSLGMFSRIDLLAVNEDEAGAIAGRDFAPDDPQPVLDACAGVLTAGRPGVRIIVTAGAQGAYGFADGRWGRCPAVEVPVASTAGAGDALLAGVLAALACGLPLLDPGPSPGSLRDRPLAGALGLGVLLAGLSVTSPHTIHPDANLHALLVFAEERGITVSDRVRDGL